MTIKHMKANLSERILKHNSVFAVEYNGKIYKVEGVIEITNHYWKKKGKEVNVEIGYMPEELEHLKDEIINTIRGGANR